MESFLSNVKSKRIFILTSSGKPIFANASQDDEELVNIFGLMQAMISIVEAANDTIKVIQTTIHKIVFLLKENIYLICLTNTEENEFVLQAQLDFMYQHILMILTSKIHSILTKNPSTDIRGLLGSDADQILGSTCRGTLCPAYVAFQALPTGYLDKSLRDEIASHLRAATEGSGAALGLVLRGGEGGAGEGGEVLLMHKNSQLELNLCTSDLILLMHFLTSSTSLRSFPQHYLPLCLPRFNRTGYLHLYVGKVHIGGVGGGSGNSDKNGEILQLVLIAVSGEGGVFQSLLKGKNYFEKALGAGEGVDSSGKELQKKIVAALPLYRSRLTEVRDTFTSLHFLFLFSLILPTKGGGGGDGTTEPVRQYVCSDFKFPWCHEEGNRNEIWLGYEALMLRMRRASSTFPPTPPALPLHSDSPLPPSSPALQPKWAMAKRGGAVVAETDDSPLIAPPHADHSLVLHTLASGIVLVGFATFDSELFITFPPQVNPVEACSRAESACRSLKMLIPSLSCQMI
eukprot:gene30786-37194_t